MSALRVISGTAIASGEEVRAALRELHKRAVLVQLQPAALDRQLQTDLVFGRRAFLAEQKRPVDQVVREERRSQAGTVEAPGKSAVRIWRNKCLSQRMRRRKL